VDVDSQTWLAVASGADERACAELALVLEARAIPSRPERRGREWVLCVRPEDASAAAAELASYRRENVRLRAPAPPPQAIGTGGFGVVSFLAVLMIMAICVHELAFGVDWLAVGRMDADRMLAGEWWRTVTALTLHVDTAHLLANAGFGALFCYFLGRYLGGGVGWIAIVLAGTLGNALNGWLEAPGHLSIGASTAVFGALGLLTAYTWRRGFPRGTSFRARVAPVVAGIALLAYTGTGGPNTDIGAHLTGFAMGFAIGFAVARAPLPTSMRVQIAAGLAAWLLVIGAWIWGIVAID